MTKNVEKPANAVGKLGSIFKNTVSAVRSTGKVSTSASTTKQALKNESMEAETFWTPVEE